MALALCKVEDVKMWVEGLHNTAKQDALLSQLITMVSDRIEQYCNREFEYAATITEQHDSDGAHDYIIVRRPPIATVASLYNDPDLAFGSGTLVAAADYTAYTDGSGIVQLLGGKFMKGFRSVKVTYAGGYTYQTLPASLKEACILQTVTLFKRREQADLVSVSGAGGSISKFEPLQLIEEVRQAIDPFVLYRPY
jgi:hypothetical protein